jgi:hypothetical protein
MPLVIILPERAHQGKGSRHKALRGFERGVKPPRNNASVAPAPEAFEACQIWCIRHDERMRCSSANVCGGSAVLLPGKISISADYMICCMQLPCHAGYRRCSSRSTYYMHASLLKCWHRCCITQCSEQSRQKNLSAAAAQRSVSSLFHTVFATESSVQHTMSTEVGA